MPDISFGSDFYKYDTREKLLGAVENHSLPSQQLSYSARLLYADIMEASRQLEPYNIAELRKSLHDMVNNYSVVEFNLLRYIDRCKAANAANFDKEILDMLTQHINATTDNSSLYIKQFSNLINSYPEKKEVLKLCYDNLKQSFSLYTTYSIDFLKEIASADTRTNKFATSKY